MKKIFFAALAVATIFSSCSKQEAPNPDGGKLKSLEFSLGIVSPATRMSDGSVTTSVIAAVRANIQNITIEYFNSSNASLGTYPFTSDQIKTVKEDDQAGTRKAVTLNNIPAETQKVNVYMNVTTNTDINDLQISYKTMEYRGVNAVIITLKPGGAGTGTNGNDIYEVQVPIQPVLSRFEFQGAVSDIKINSGDGNKPADLTPTQDRAEALKHVSESTIKNAEAAAQNAWREANVGSPDPVWTYKYAVTYTSNTPYTINSIDGYYMNNIPLTKGGALVLNANDAVSDWNPEAKENYKADGKMKKMYDVTAPAQGENIAYNLFPQTFTPAAAGNPTVNEVKTKMPHFILKLTTSETPVSTRWLTIRAFRSTDIGSGTPLIANFEAKKAYVLKASEIVINQYTAKLKVEANGTPGPEIPEVIDPTDPKPEPQGKDLEVRVEVLEWDVVYVKPEM